MHGLTFNTLLSLIFQAKITGKGKKGNGKIFIRLLSIIADCPIDSDKEKFLLSLFSSHANKQDAYQKINRFLFDFVQNGNGFPAKKITLQTFEGKINLHGKTDWKYYRLYLAETGKFCTDILDKEKIPAFVNTMLELLKEDITIQNIFYGGQFLPKNSLISDTPKKICLEALLLGLLYHTLKKFTPADAGGVMLSDSEKINFQLIQLGTAENLVFWGDFEKLKQLLNPEISVSVKENLQIKNLPEWDFYYPLEMQYQNKIILWNKSFFDEINQKYIFLCASGGMGKSFLLQHQNGLFLALSGYRKEFQEQINPDCSCWILIQILLKYHYHFAYPTYALCAACEDEKLLFRQIAELLNLFRKKTQIPEYTLLLDGMNEMSPEFQDDFIKELAYICENWHNVRIILSSRTVPQHEIFQTFQRIEILGIPDNERNKLLKNHPDAIRSQQLLEILKTPLFLKYFLKSQSSSKAVYSRGEILEFYFENQLKHYEKPLQFVIKYALPILAKNQSSIFKRSDVSKAIQQTAELFLHDEEIYQDFLSLQGFLKFPILKSLETTDFVGLLIEKLGILAVIDNHLEFAHDYILHYFSAKYILNAIHVVSQTGSQEVFNRFKLDNLWWTYEVTPYVLLGEICEDYRNIPDENGVLNYHRTELDTILDIARTFGATNLLTASVIQTMKFSRNCLICNVDFSCLALPVFMPYQVKFSNDGDYPSNFHGCKIYNVPDNAPDIFCADFSFDGKRLLLGMSDGHVILFDIRAGKVLKNYNLHPYLKEEEAFESITFLNDEEFTIATASSEFLIKKAAGQMITITSQKKHFPYHRRLTAVSPDYQHFLIDDILYSVTGERKKIMFPERYNHFKNCDFRNFTSLFHHEENKEILWKSGAIIE